MRGRTRRLALAVLAAGAVAFVVSGGLATAGKLITGRQLAPGTITRRELANGAVTARKLARGVTVKGAKGDRGAPGPAGPAGGQGPKGDTGARGPAGALDVIDAQGRRIGLYAGLFGGPYVTAYTDEGALLIYDNSPTISYPIIVSGTALFYRAGSCAGTPYGQFTTSYPIQVPWIVEAPAVPGSRMYVGVPSAPEDFTYQSVRSAGGCSNTSARAQLIPLREAGTVPAIAKPLVLAPVS